MPRKCRYPGCVTILEHNNKGPACHLHKKAWLDLIDERIKSLEYRLLVHKKYIREAERLKHHKCRVIYLERRVMNLKARRQRQYMQVVNEIIMDRKPINNSED